jgi:DNA adenine methylase
MEVKIQKPFLKWVGGKTQHIRKIIDSFPATMENYHEIFLGGGSVLLAILSMQKAKKINIKGNIYAYDLNSQLIRVYQDIQNNKSEIITCVERYKKEYENCPNVERGQANRKPTTKTEAKTSKESYYYWLRKTFNEMQELCIEKSALFIILNKTCFRGMYRTGPNGFNVPFGHYKKTPAIISRTEIDNISELIKNVMFTCTDFTNSIKNATEGDFVYLDPPYVPVNKKSFVGYTANGFDIDMHKNLFKLTKELTTKNINFAMSNSNAEFVKKSFEGYILTEISARRAINSKNPGSKVTDVLIVNIV